MKVGLNSELIRKEITEYPCFGISENNTVVLFHKEGCGTVVSIGGGNRKLGDYRTGWRMHGFYLFKY